MLAAIRLVMVDTTRERSVGLNPGLYEVERACRAAKYRVYVGANLKLTVAPSTSPVREILYSLFNFMLKGGGGGELNYIPEMLRGEKIKGGIWDLRFQPVSNTLTRTCDSREERILPVIQKREGSWKKISVHRRILNFWEIWSRLSVLILETVTQCSPFVADNIFSALEVDEKKLSRSVPPSLPIIFSAL